MLQKDQAREGGHEQQPNSQGTFSPSQGKVFTMLSLRRVRPQRRPSRKAAQAIHLRGFMQGLPSRRNHGLAWSTPNVGLKEDGRDRRFKHND
jgi:hypothetical protein